MLNRTCHVSWLKHYTSVPLSHVRLSSTAPRVRDLFFPVAEAKFLSTPVFFWIIHLRAWSKWKQMEMEKGRMGWNSSETVWAREKVEEWNLKDGNGVEVPKNYAQLKIFSIHSRIFFFFFLLPLLAEIFIMASQGLSVKSCYSFLPHSIHIKNDIS